MAKHLQRGMDNLQGQLLEQASSVEGAVRQAVYALAEHDSDAALRVIAGDEEVDRAENRLGDECLKVFALYQPVAVDLRAAAAVLQINTDLERVADLAAHIAERAINLTRRPPVPIPARLQHLSDLAISMVRQSVEAFVKRDANKARQVIRLFDEADRRAAEVIGHIAGLMRQSPELIEAGLSLFSATQHLAQIANHAAGIAARVVYMIEGDTISRVDPVVRGPARTNLAP